MLTVRDPEWAKFKKRLPKQRRDRAKLIEQAILSKSEEGKRMWADAVVLVDLCHPMVTMLRMADGQAPCTGEVYHFMYTLQEHVKAADLGGRSAEEGAARRSALEALLLLRWDFLHQPIYAAAYALNPQFLHQNLEDENEVMQGLRSTLENLLGPDLVNVACRSGRTSGHARGRSAGRPHLQGRAACCPTGFGTVMGRPARSCGPLLCVCWRSALQPAHVSATGQPMSLCTAGSAIVLGCRRHNNWCMSFRTCVRS